MSQPVQPCPAKPYMDPYLAGVAIGLVLLASYVLVGHGLGASGAFSSVAAAGAAAIEGPRRASASPALAAYLPNGLSSPFRDWFVLQLAGVALGGALSAFLAGRARIAVERGARIGVPARMWSAICGGALMGIGAKVARGCTSGQALTGGALLSAGSWTFIGACFLSGYALAPLARRLWR